MNGFTWFKVTVETPHGIRGEHYLQDMWASNVRQKEEDRGFKVLSVEVWGRNTQFPNLPNYVGR